MNSPDQAGTDHGRELPPKGGEQLVYLVPAQPGTSPSGPGAPDLRVLVRGLLRAWKLVTLVTAAFAIAGVSYSLLATKWYKAGVTLSPVRTQTLPGGLGQFAGLASLAGIALPASGSAEALAVLRSRDFSARFVADMGLLPLLFSERWDAQSRTWKPDGSRRTPDIRDGVKRFNERVLVVEEDKKTGLVLVSVRWTDPVVAAQWANELVRRLNDRVRERTVRESERNIEFLRAQMLATSVVPLQQSVGRVLETELQKLMLAKGNDEFAFKVIDPATVPVEKYRPQRILITLLATFLGFAIGASIALARTGERADH